MFSRRLVARANSAAIVRRAATPLMATTTAAAPAAVVGTTTTANGLLLRQQFRHCATSEKKPDEAPAAKADEGDDVVVEPTDAHTPDLKGAAQEDTEKELEGTAEESGFKTETRQLLDIVACSLYSDKEVFVRELVSNASDALEKRRHLQLLNEAEYPAADANAADQQPGIYLTTNQSKSRFVIRDTGIGMSKEELQANLGTIASSGSKAFVRELQAQNSDKGAAGVAAADKIIGQFGVGFYSAFMVAKHVKVYSRSAKAGSKGYVWESDGTGKYTIKECEGVSVGTKIVLDVKDTEMSFCTPQVIERIIKKYSNFVEYPIQLNGGKLNTVEALWMKSKSEITNEEHVDFYKFISGAYDSPMSRLHYIIDAPLSIRALLYIPQSHTEKFGGGRMESGINLYCRRVLIQSKAKNVLPEWLRFIKGAVDCESMPLNISREHTQDGGTMRKLSNVVTKRIIRWLEEEARKDRPKFEKFIKEFGSFLKEGVCTDQVYKMDIAKLLRFESTKSDTSFPLVSLDEYKDRMQANQTHIYFITAPSRDMAMHSPYYEQYKEHDLEVLVLTETIDEFVMNHLETYAKHKLQNIETYDANHDGWVQHKKKQDDLKDDNKAKIKKELTEDQVKTLSEFVSKQLLGRVGIVKATTRLSNSPAVLADHESAQMRKLYRITGQQQGPAPKYNFHFNPQHELIRKLYTLAASTDASQNETAGMLVEQLFDNAVIAAGLLDDPRSIVSRVNNIMTRMVANVEEPSAGPAVTEGTEKKE